MIQKWLNNFISIIFCCFILIIILTQFSSNSSTEISHGGSIFSSVLLLLITLIIFLLFAFLISKSNKKYFRLTFYTILLSSLLLKVYWVINVKTVPTSDFENAYLSAIKVMNGDFSSFGEGEYFSRFPHYSFYIILLAKVFSIINPNVEHVIMLNIIFLTLSSLIIYFIVAEIRDKRAGIIAFALFSYFPPVIIFSSVLITDIFAIPFVLLSVYLFILFQKDYKNGKIRYSLLVYSAVALSFAHLFRNVGYVLIIAIIIVLILTTTFKQSLKLVMVYLFAFLFVIVSISGVLKFEGIISNHLWQAENPIEITFVVGLNRESQGKFNAEDAALYKKYNGNTEIIKEEARQIIKDRLLEEGDLGKLFINKIKTVWNTPLLSSLYWSSTPQFLKEQTVFSEKIQGYENQVKLYRFTNNIYIGMLLFIFFNSLFFIKRKDEHSLLTNIKLIFIGFFILFLFIEVQSRYIFVISPLIMVLASVGIIQLYDMSFERLQFRKLVSFIKGKRGKFLK